MDNETNPTEDTYEYEYLLWEFCKSPDGAVLYELRDVKPLPDGPLPPYRKALVPWALASLSALTREIGLYYAVFSPADPDGLHSALPIDSHYVTWGTGALAA